MTTATLSPRETLIASMKALIGDATTPLTAEQGKQYDQFDKALGILTQVEKATLNGVKMEDIDVSADGQLVSRRQSGNDLTRLDTSGNPNQQAADRPAIKGNGDRRYAAMFGLKQLNSNGFSTIHEIGNALRSGDSQRLRQMAISGNSAGIPADGGFLIPEQFVSDSLDKSLEAEIVRPRCRVEPMTSPIKHISSFDDSDHTDGELYGGVVMRFEQEGEEIQYNILKTRRVTLTAHKAAGLFSATNELLTDAPESAGGMQTRMSGAFAWNVDRICLATGTGAGQPRAILKDPALLTVAKEVGQAADTLVYENFVNMFARMHPACLQRAVWVCNQTAIPQLLRLVITIGTGGQVIPVMTKSGDGYEILGRPVIFTEKLSALGDLGDVMFVDFSQYALGLLRNGFRLDMSQHVKFTTDETVWRLIMRFDGQGLWKTFFTPLNGDTLSWCVTLQAR